MNLENLKVALVHDWLTGMRGAERCLEVFCEIFPQADIFTLFHQEGSVSETIESHEIHTSFLQKIPGWQKFYRYLYPLMPTAIERFDFRGYDIVLSGSACVAKGVIVPHDVLHISYIYSPMRYAWEMYDDYFGDKSSMAWWKRIVIPPQLHYIRMWDVISTNRVDKLVADSKHVADRIEKIYRREADVIYPPVDTERMEIRKRKEDFYLMVTAFAPNKRVDLAIEAFNKLGLPLKIVGGTGRLQKEMKDRANDNIEFLGWQDDEKVADLYSRARAFVFPGIDDFGITPLEAMASGTPVIAFGGGGALETVVPINPRYGKKYRKSPTGVFFYQPTAHALIDAIELFQKHSRSKGWKREKMRKHAKSFNRKKFKKNFYEYINSERDSFKRSRSNAKVFKAK